MLSADIVYPGRSRDPAEERETDAKERTDDGQREE